MTLSLTEHSAEIFHSIIFNLCMKIAVVFCFLKIKSMFSISMIIISQIVFVVNIIIKNVNGRYIKSNHCMRFYKHFKKTINKLHNENYI